MSKKIKLTERQLGKTINEISYGTVSNAYEKNGELFDEFHGAYDTFDDFYEKLKDLEDVYQYAINGLLSNPNFDLFHLEKNNKYHNRINSLFSNIHYSLKDLIKYSDEVKNILDRKEKQKDNFYDSMSKYDKKYGADDDLSYNDFMNGEINNV